MGKLYRQYKINFNFNKEHEIAYVPGEYYNLHKVFTEPFFQADKAVISFFLQIYYLAYTKYFNTAICFTEAELLHKIKRNSETHLKTFVDEVKKLGLFRIVNLSESTLSLYRPERYCFELNLDIAKEYASDKGVYSHV